MSFKSHRGRNTQIEPIIYVILVVAMLLGSMAAVEASSHSSDRARLSISNLCDGGFVLLYEQDGKLLYDTSRKYYSSLAAIPSNAIPSNAIPSNAIPSNAIPSNAIPSNAIPSNAIPSNAIPSNALAGEIRQAIMVQPLPSNQLSPTLLAVNWAIPSNALPPDTAVAGLIKLDLKPLPVLSEARARLSESTDLAVRSVLHKTLCPSRLDRYVERRPAKKLDLGRKLKSLWRRTKDDASYSWGRSKDRFSDVTTVIANGFKDLLGFGGNQRTSTGVEFASGGSSPDCSEDLSDASVWIGHLDNGEVSVNFVLPVGRSFDHDEYYLALLNPELMATCAPLPDAPRRLLCHGPSPGSAMSTMISLSPKGQSCKVQLPVTSIDIPSRSSPAAVADPNCGPEPNRASDGCDVWESWCGCVGGSVTSGSSETEYGGGGGSEVVCVPQPCCSYSCALP